MSRPRRSMPLGPSGQMVDAELVDIVESTERWCDYALNDGSVVKLKPVVVEIWRAVDQYDGEGNPLYIVKSGNVVNVVAPDALRKKMS